MKKVLFSVFLVSIMVVGAQAQKSSCAKSCTAKPASAAACHSQSASTASTASVVPGHCTAPSTEAAKLASTDPTIETVVCPDGTVCYVRKVTDASNGQATYVSLSYDATTNTFVNVAPSSMEEHNCSGKATSASAKSGCAGAASGKACCAGKAKSASAATTTTTSGQAVKTSGSIKN